MYFFKLYYFCSSWKRLCSKNQQEFIDLLWVTKNQIKEPALFDLVWKRKNKPGIFSDYIAYLIDFEWNTKEYLKLINMDMTEQ